MVVISLTLCVYDEGRVTVYFLLLDDGDIRTVGQDGTARWRGRVGDHRRGIDGRHHVFEQQAIARYVGEDGVGVVFRFALFVLRFAARGGMPHVDFVIQHRHRYQIIGEGLRGDVQLFGRTK